MSEVFKQLQEKNQAALSPEDRLAVLVLCEEENVDLLACSKEKYHTGDHVAHGMAGNILARWPIEVRTGEEGFDVGGEG